MWSEWSVLVCVWPVVKVDRFIERNIHSEPVCSCRLWDHLTWLLETSGCTAEVHSKVLILLGLGQERLTAVDRWPPYTMTISYRQVLLYTVVVRCGADMLALKGLD